MSAKIRRATVFVGSIWGAILDRIKVEAGFLKSIFLALWQWSIEELSSRSAIQFRMVILTWLTLFVPLCTYSIINWDVPGVSSEAQFSIVSTAPILGALTLAAAARQDWIRELVKVSQKFILSTVLLIVFIVALTIFPDTNNSWELSSGTAWVRGIYFWSAAFCFFAGISLFLIALVDLVFALSRIGDDSDSINSAHI